MKRVRERGRERKREGGRERERKREEGERERDGERIVIFFKGMTGALAPFSYLVIYIIVPAGCSKSEQIG